MPGPNNGITSSFTENPEEFSSEIFCTEMDTSPHINQIHHEPRGDPTGEHEQDKYFEDNNIQDDKNEARQKTQEDARHYKNNVDIRLVEHWSLQSYQASINSNGKNDENRRNIDKNNHGEACLNNGTVEKGSVYQALNQRWIRDHEFVEDHEYQSLRKRVADHRNDAADEGSVYQALDRGANGLNNHECEESDAYQGLIS